MYNGKSRSGRGLDNREKKSFPFLARFRSMVWNRSLPEIRMYTLTTELSRENGRIPSEHPIGFSLFFIA